MGIPSSSWREFSSRVRSMTLMTLSQCFGLGDFVVSFSRQGLFCGVVFKLGEFWDVF